jgi:hypothetical protein
MRNWLWLLVVSALLLAGTAGYLAWTSMRADFPDEARGRALESCIRNYTTEAGRRDAAEALRTGDARLLYRVEFYQEGSLAYVPGIEIIGVSGEGWMPSKDLAELVGRFDGDKNWYWVGVRAPKLTQSYRSGAQDSPQLARCRKAEFAYLEAYNRAVPPDRVPRRPAPEPDPRFAVAGGRPPIDAASDARP